MDEKSIGVTKFLQLEPQNHSIEALLKAQYNMVSHTRAEWHSIIKALLGSRAR